VVCLQQGDLEIAKDGRIGQQIDGGDPVRAEDQIEHGARDAARCPDQTHGPVDERGLGSVRPAGEGPGHGRRAAQLAGEGGSAVGQRAALALAEAVTRLSDRPDPVPDDVWNDASLHYDEQALAALILSIATTNVFNRLNVTTRQVPGAWG